jgi:enamine deaminase RidA (YjgF/YER057c/UK114 family)
MSSRKNISSGAKWEDMVGYSRAVIIGDTMEIAGTTAVIDGVLIGKDDPYLQTKTILQKISDVLSSQGWSLQDVIRTTVYVTDISQWESVGRAHGEFFRDIKPASAMIEVKGLIDPDMLVEIETTAPYKVKGHMQVDPQCFCGLQAAIFGMDLRAIEHRPYADFAIPIL